VSRTPDEAAAYLRSEYKNWGEIVKRSGVEME
jgi:tripartite-type tricarboxylate transporter receptor subunit TctC